MTNLDVFEEMGVSPERAAMFVGCFDVDGFPPDMVEKGRKVLDMNCAVDDPASSRAATRDWLVAMVAQRGILQ